VLELGDVGRLAIGVEHDGARLVAHVDGRADRALAVDAQGRPAIELAIAPSRWSSCTVS
jgi:hypothetical protein